MRQTSRSLLSTFPSRQIPLRYWIPAIVLCAIPPFTISGYAIGRFEDKPDRREQIPVEVIVEYKEEGDDCFLPVRLTNRSKKTIEISQSELPWSHDYSIVLIAMKVDGINAKPLHKAVYFDDPAAGSTTLKPGASAEGRIYLNTRFPSFPEARRASDIVIFWSYKGDTQDGEEICRQGGWINVTRKSWPTQIPVEVIVEYKEKGDDCFLLVRLTNRSKKTIEIFDRELPWSQHSGMILSAKKVDGINARSVLTTLFPDDPAAGSTKVNPGASKEGRIDLNLRFPGFPQERRASDIVIFWSYKGHTVDGEETNRQGGWREVRKK